MQKLLGYLKGVPGIIGALLLAVIIFQLYVHAREKAAVERAQWQATLDSLSTAHRADSAAAALRDAARMDTIRRFQLGIAKAQAAATAAASTAASASAALHGLLDSNVVATALLDSLEQAHAGEVTAWRRALAFADSVHQQDSLRLADRDRQLVHLRLDLVDMTHRADRWERAAHPGWLAEVFHHPITHAAFAVGGYVLGKVGP